MVGTTSASGSKVAPQRRATHDATAWGERIGRHRLGVERARQGAANERRRLLARLADAEVDDVHPARGDRLLCLGEAHERVARHPGEDGVQAHANASIVS
jgi:hypothetical protein